MASLISRARTAARDIVEAVPGTGVHERQQTLDDVARRWREQCAEVAVAGAALQEALAGLGHLRREIDTSDPEHANAYELPYGLMYRFNGQGSPDHSAWNRGQFQLMIEEWRRRG